MAPICNPPQNNKQIQKYKKTRNIAVSLILFCGVQAGFTQRGVPWDSPMSRYSQQVRGRIIKQLRKGDSGVNSYDNSNGKDEIHV